MKQPIELRKLRDFGQVINDAFGFFKENFKVLIKSLLIICGFFLLMGTVTTTFTYMNMSYMYSGGLNNVDSFQSHGIPYLISVLINSLVLVLTQASIHLVTLCYISVYLQKNNTKPTFAEVWAYFKYYFFRVVGSGLLIIILTCVAFVLCIIPAFYVMPIFYLIIPIIVIENSSFSYAWNKSFRIIKNNWWFTFGVIFIMGIIVGSADGIASLPLSLIGILSKYLSLKSFTLPLIILFSILHNLIILAYCIPAIAITLCYFDLSEQKEGTGIMDRIANFGKTDNTPNLPAEEY